MRVITCLLAFKSSPGALADRNTPIRWENPADRAFASRTAWRRAACRLGFIVGIVVIACLATTASLAQSPVNIFGNAVPPNPVESDPNAVTLGVKFWSTLPGTIAGIRFYRGHTNQYGYTVRLYTAAGSLLAQATTSEDTCTVPCWEQVNFSAPISTSANTTYVAAYYTSNGYYPDSYYGLTTGATNGPLFAPASGVSGGNGIYVYGKGFPTSTWEDSNYYVDVSFTPSAPTPYLTLSFNPPNPSIASNAPVGTVVATIAATWSDGTPFTGTLSFGAPYSNDNATFAISGNSLIVNSAGPGVSADGGTTQNVTVIAAQ
jgi:Domain of unknown function (DUF4082)